MLGLPNEMFNQDRSIYICMYEYRWGGTFFSYKHLNITVNLLWRLSRTQLWFMSMAGRLFPTRLHGSFSAHLPKQIKFKMVNDIWSTTNFCGVEAQFYYFTYAIKCCENGRDVKIAPFTW